jgi:CubicO group peptidase (beta-lactamase class C family)
VSELTQLVSGLIECGEVSAVAAAVAQRGRIVASAGLGGPAGHDPLGWRFDLASLTKPLVATAALALVRAQRLDLDAPLGTWLPELPQRVARRPLWALLAHRSGLAAWTSLAARSWSLADVPRRVGEAGLAGAAPAVYSDLGYLVLGLLVERVAGVELERVVADRVSTPLGLVGLSGPRREDPSVCPVVLDRCREVELAEAQQLTIPDLGPPARGWPQDGNAAYLGRWCGHAGAFGTAMDLLRCGQEWLAPGRVLTSSLVERALATPRRGRFALGWWRRRVAGAAGPALGPRAFGHLGFAGGSWWIDPERDLVAVLLAHRTRVDVDLTETRRRFHRMAVAAAERD